MVKKLYIDILFVFIFCFKVCFSNNFIVNKITYIQSQDKGYYFDIDKSDRMTLIQIKNKVIHANSGIYIIYSRFLLTAYSDFRFFKINNYIKLFLFDFRKKIFEVMRSKFFGSKYKEVIVLP